VYFHYFIPPRIYKSFNPYENKHWPVNKAQLSEAPPFWCSTRNSFKNYSHRERKWVLYVAMSDLSFAGQHAPGDCQFGFSREVCLILWYGKGKTIVFVSRNPNIKGNIFAI
jgi:hypothetical protein